MEGHQRRQGKNPKTLSKRANFVITLAVVLKMAVDDKLQGAYHETTLESFHGGAGDLMRVKMVPH
jgi:hypothetical protein